MTRAEVLETGVTTLEEIAARASVFMLQHVSSLESNPDQDGWRIDILIDKLYVVEDTDLANALARAQDITDSAFPPTAPANRV